MEKSTINRYITIDYNTIVTKNIEYAIVKSEVVNFLTIYNSVSQSQCGVNINELYKLMNYFTPNNIDKILSALIKDNVIYINNSVCYLIDNENINFIEDVKTKKQKSSNKKTKKEDIVINSSALFDQCWTLYKRKGSKKLSLAQWGKIPTEDYIKIPNAIKKYVESRDVMYQKDFERYLRDKVYENVIYDKSGNKIYDPQSKDDEYYPTLSNEIIKNEKGYIYFGMSIDNIIDGYDNEDRPNGAVLILSNGRGTISWNNVFKKWVVSPFGLI